MKLCSVFPLPQKQRLLPFHRQSDVFLPRQPGTSSAAAAWAGILCRPRGRAASASGTPTRRTVAHSVSWPTETHSGHCLAEESRFLERKEMCLRKRETIMHKYFMFIVIFFSAGKQNYEHLLIFEYISLLSNKVYFPYTQCDRRCLICTYYL